MFQSNRDIRWAIDSKRLIISPRPEEIGAGYDETSIDLHLDKIEEAKVWNISRFIEREAGRGSHGPELHVGRFNYIQFGEEYLINPPEESSGTASELVLRRGNQIIVKPGGFLLWQTKEKVGTPSLNPGFVCFVNGKSTRARTGIVVHLTAPTIHAGWQGNITLEIANLGPFHFILQENDVIAQLTVATISSPPDETLRFSPSTTASQEHVTGKSSRKSKRRKK